MPRTRPGSWPSSCGGGLPQALLQTYDTERMAAAGENLEITETTMRFLVPQNEAERAHRLDVLERALSDPEARSQVDSGRMYEPFWYVDSPLTTPSLDRPFPGRPARGQVLPPLPGVIVPDTPITDPERPEASRLRDIARDGLLVLVADDVARDDIQAFVTGLTAVPVRTVTLGTLTPHGRLAVILGAKPGEAWVVRPDCHIAAVVPGRGSRHPGRRHQPGPGLARTGQRVLSQSCEAARSFYRCRTQHTSSLGPAYDAEFETTIRLLATFDTVITCSHHQSKASYQDTLARTGERTLPGGWCPGGSPGPRSPACPTRVPRRQSGQGRWWGGEWPEEFWGGPCKVKFEARRWATVERLVVTLRKHIDRAAPRRSRTAQR